MNLRNALVLLGLLCALLFWLALHPTPEPASANPGQTTIAQASRCRAKSPSVAAIDADG